MMTIYDRRNKFSFLIIPLIFLSSVCSSQLPKEYPETIRAAANLTVTQAELAIKAGQYDDAFRLYAQLDSNHTLNSTDYLLISAIYNNIGSIHEKLNRYQFALMYYEQGLKILENKGVSQISEALANIRASEKGYVGSDGDPVNPDLYTGEIKPFREFMHRKNQDIENDLSVILLMNAGNMYFQQSQLDQAESLYKKARLIMSSALTWQADANLAWLELERNNYKRAEIILTSVINAQEESTPPVELRRAFLAIGASYRKQNSYEKSFDFIQLALSLYEKAGDVRGECRTLAHLGTLKFETGSPQAAISSYQKALTANENLQDAEAAWHANGGLAKCYQMINDFDMAVRYYTAYFDIVKRVGKRFSTDQGRVSFLENHTEIYKDYIRAELQLAERNQDYRNVRVAIEQLRDEGFRNLLRTRRNKMNLEPGHISARDFITMQHFPLSSGSGLPENPFPTLRGVYFPEPASSGMNVSQISPGVESYMPVNENFPGISSSSTEQDVLPYDSLLIPETTFLEYFLLPEKILILIKTLENRIYGTSVTIAEDSLSALIVELGRSLGVDENDRVSIVRNFLPKDVNIPAATVRQFRDISQLFYKMLISPMDSIFQRINAKTLVIVPHSGLWQIPFAALIDEGGDYFGDKCPINYASSEENWRLIAGTLRRSDHQSARAWIVGNPDMPDSINVCDLTIQFQPIHGSEQEAESIALLFGKNNSDLFVGAAADRLRLETWHSEFSVIHLATHGFACIDDPLSSLIVLSALDSNMMRIDRTESKIYINSESRFPVTIDNITIEDGPAPPMMLPDAFRYPGYLDARTIIQSFQLNADLVTLSACQSGLGKFLNQGTVGLSRAFLKAGARSVLVSLWNVDDQSTKLLMTQFYKDYLKHGDKAEALRSAMMKIRQEFPHPKYWAAFTLVGMGK